MNKIKSCTKILDESLPTFEILRQDLDICGAEADLCVKITYGDGTNDFISAKESPRAKSVLKGRLRSNGRKAVIIRADKDNDEDTVNITRMLYRLYLQSTMVDLVLIKINRNSYIFQVVFNSGKTGSCVRFSVNLLARGTVSCLDDAPRPNHSDIDGLTSRLSSFSGRSAEEIRRDPRSIDPNGYKYILLFYLNK